VAEEEKYARDTTFFIPSIADSKNMRTFATLLRDKAI
jgi:hypothetical protein